MITAPYEQTPTPPEMVAGRGMLDLAALPPEVIQLLISYGILDQNGMPIGGEMNMMRNQGGDPRVEAIQRAIGAGPAPMPAGY